MRSWLAALVVLVCLPFAALAADKPTELNGGIAATQPVGIATLSKLLLHVYDISFWSDTGGWQRPPYAISIVYAMDFSSEKLVKRTYKEMKLVSSQPDETLQHYRERLAAIIPDVKDGDRLTALALPDETRFYANGREVGRIDGTEFQQAFFGIWLSPKSSEPEIQQQLTHPISQ